MGLFESLPDEPLKRPQIERLEGMQPVRGVHAIYSELNPDTAYGIVILLNGTLRAWGYADEREEWIEFDTREIDTESDDPDDIDELVDEFLDTIATEIGVITVDR